MAYTESYIPENGNMAFSANGYQRIKSTGNSIFYFLSEISTDISIDNKWQLDACWETSDFYHISGTYVYKKKYDGTLLASYDFTNPVSLSVIQPSIPMSNDIQNFSFSDLGCWIVDATDKKLIKTDAYLNEVNSITNLSDPSYVIATPDGGCYLFEDGTDWIMKISSLGEVQAYLTYDTISISDSSDVKATDSDFNNGLWVIVDNTMYGIEFSDGGLSIDSSIDILSDLSISAGYVTDLSIEKSSISTDVYIVGCHTGGAWIARYDLNGSLVNFNTSLSATCPFLVKASQWGYSDAVYLISEEDDELIPEECLSSSSTSSYEGSTSSLGGISKMVINETFIVGGEPYLIYSSSSSSSVDSSSSSSYSSSSSSSIDSSSSSSGEPVALWASSSSSVDSSSSSVV